MRRRPLVSLLLFLVVIGVVIGAVFVLRAADNKSCPPGQAERGRCPAASVPTTLHYAVNVGAHVAVAASMGFDLYDVNGSTFDPHGVKALVDALPAGGKALVWVGGLDNGPKGSICPAPRFSYAQFVAQVDALAKNSRVFGYYLADEPHPSVCSNAATDIRARADYIHANAPGQRAFIVVLDGYAMCGSSLGCEYRALQPAASHVDYVGLDPYPCHYDGGGNPAPCDVSTITTHVQAAERNGIPASVIVPVFQTFGQYGRTGGQTAYYRLPSARELQAMLDTWAGLVPAPAFDFAYTFGVQCTAGSCPAPQAIANEPSIQGVVTAHNEAG